MEIIFALFPFILFFTFIYFLILRKIPAYLRYKKTIEQIVQHGANDDLTKEIIQYFNKMGIPNNPTSWDTARANFELINESNGVSVELKHELRRTLLGKGVNRLQKVNEHDRRKVGIK